MAGVVVSTFHPSIDASGRDGEEGKLSFFAVAHFGCVVNMESIGAEMLAGDVLMMNDEGVDIFDDG